MEEHKKITTTIYLQELWKSILWIFYSIIFAILPILLAFVYSYMSDLEFEINKVTGSGVLLIAILILFLNTVRECLRARTNFPVDFMLFLLIFAIFLLFSTTVIYIHAQFPNSSHINLNIYHVNIINIVGISTSVAFIVSLRTSMNAQRRKNTK